MKILQMKQDMKCVLQHIQHDFNDMFFEYYIIHRPFCSFTLQSHL